MHDFLAFGSASRWEIQIVEIDDGTCDDEFSSVHLCLGLETSYRLPSKIWTYRIAYVQTWTFSQELEAGRRSHFEGCLSESVPDCEELEKPGASKISAPSGRRAEYLGPPGRSFVDWIEWIPTVQSKEAVASTSGLREDQSTWKAQLSAKGSYAHQQTLISDHSGP
jgi:hypothetical protein